MTSPVIGTPWKKLNAPVSEEAIEGHYMLPYGHQDKFQFYQQLNSNLVFSQDNVS